MKIREKLHRICEKLREKKEKIRFKNWCFEYVLRKHETKEQLVWQINEVYEHGTLISYLVYTYYELLDGTRNISGFCRLKKKDATDQGTII
jgi:hypothetical protein